MPQIIVRQVNTEQNHLIFPLQDCDKKEVTIGGWGCSLVLPGAEGLLASVGREGDLFYVRHQDGSRAALSKMPTFEIHGWQLLFSTLKLEKLAKSEDLPRYRDANEEAFYDAMYTKDAGLSCLLSNIEAGTLPSGAILLMGESGVGREYIARAIHRARGLREEQFSTVDCAQEDFRLPKLHPGELGSLTGTLLLRNVDALPVERFAPWVQFFQSHCSKELHLICTGASYSPWLPTTFSVPALRYRKLDIIPLFMRFLQKYSGSPTKTFRLSANAKNKLMLHPWFRNLTELREIAQVALLTTSSEEIQAEDILLPSETVSEHKGLKDFERMWWFRVVEAAKNVEDAARCCGVSTGDLYHILKEHTLPTPTELKKSLALLYETESRDNVREIASELGVSKVILALEQKQFENMQTDKDLGSLFDKLYRKQDRLDLEEEITQAESIPDFALEERKPVEQGGS